MRSHGENEKTCLEIQIFIKVPWEVRRLLVNRVVLVDRERSRGILETENATFSGRIVR